MEDSGVPHNSRNMGRATQGLPVPLSWLYSGMPRLMAL